MEDDTIVVSVETLDIMKYLFQKYERMSELVLQERRLRNSETVREMPKVDR